MSTITSGRVGNLAFPAKRSQVRTPSRPRPSKVKDRSPFQPFADHDDVLTPVAEPQVAAALTHEEIAQQAYFIWLERGRPIGQAHAHWMEAQAQLAGR